MVAIAATGPLAHAPAGDDKTPSAPGTPSAADEPHRSPIALAVSTAGNRLLTANQTVRQRLARRHQERPGAHELKTGDKPAGVALSRDGHRGVVTHWYGYDMAILEIKDDKIAIAGRVEVGPEPRGVAITADGSTAYVAVGVEQRSGPRRPQFAGRSPAGSPSAASPAASPFRPTNRSCSSAILAPRTCR